MNPNTGGATDYGIYNDNFKLCGCKQHNQSGLQEAETVSQAPRNPQQISGGVNRIEYQRLAIVPQEHVLVYGSEDYVVLKDVGVTGKSPYFASTGYLVDFSGAKLPGSQILAALPVDIAKLGDTFTWPPRQAEPLGELPIDATNVNVGFARNSFRFGDGNSIVTVGAAIAKVLQLKGGGAMFWVTSAQVISQGTGRFEGSRGIQSFSGSSYFPEWPDSTEGKVGVLMTGFKAKIHRCIKVVLKESQLS